MHTTRFEWNSVLVHVVQRGLTWGDPQRLHFLHSQAHEPMRWVHVSSRGTHRGTAIIKCMHCVRCAHIIRCKFVVWLQSLVIDAAWRDASIGPPRGSQLSCASTRFITYTINSHKQIQRLNLLGQQIIKSTVPQRGKYKYSIANFHTFANLLSTLIVNYYLRIFNFFSDSIWCNLRLLWFIYVFVHIPLDFLGSQCITCRYNVVAESMAERRHIQIAISRTRPSFRSFGARQPEWGAIGRRRQTKKAAKKGSNSMAERRDKA